MGLQHSSLIGAGLKPKAEDIEVAELVPNLEDGTLWTKNDTGEVILIGAGQNVSTSIGQNILINPDLIVNQRNITTLPVSGQYWYDRWRSTGTGMVQVIEEGGYVPNAVYTYSGVGITTHQITAPSSGNWVTSEVPSTARQLKLELGVEATPFAPRPIAEEYMLCYRYYEDMGTIYGSIYTQTGSKIHCTMSFKNLKRVIPLVLYSISGDSYFNVLNYTDKYKFFISCGLDSSGYIKAVNVRVDAEIY